MDKLDDTNFQKTKLEIEKELEDGKILGQDKKGPSKVKHYIRREK